MRYCDLDTNPITQAAYMDLLEGKYRARRGSDGKTAPEDDPTRIGSTEVGDAWVSTVWLGLDHNFGDGPPLIFETMVFGGPCDGEQDRYSTKAQALAGHEAMVRRVQAANRT